MRETNDIEDWEVWEMTEEEFREAYLMPKKVRLAPDEVQEAFLNAPPLPKMEENHPYLPSREVMEVVLRVKEKELKI